MNASGTSQDSTQPDHLMRRIFGGLATGGASVVDKVRSPHLIEQARVSGGRVVEHWGEPDRFALFAPDRAARPAGRGLT